MWLELRESRSVLFACSISLCSSFTSTEAAGRGEESGAIKRQEHHTKQYKHGGVREKAKEVWRQGKPDVFACFHWTADLCFPSLQSNFPTFLFSDLRIWPSCLPTCLLACLSVLSVARPLPTPFSLFCLFVCLLCLC